MNKKKVLFISHSAGRTGAPLMLLNFLQWMKNNSEIVFEILLKSTGELEQDFTDLAPTKIFSQPPLNNLFSRIKNKLGIKNAGSHKYRHLLDYYKKAGVSLIYSNTITNGEILEALSPLGLPVITHVHELDYWIGQFGEKNLQQVKKYSSYFITASHAVERNLIDKYGFTGNIIKTIHSFIPDVPNPPPPNVRSQIRKRLHIPQDAIIVVGSGYETWRKGKDIFVQLASRIHQQPGTDNIYFLWVGGRVDNNEYAEISHEIKKTGLEQYVQFCGEVNNPLDYFAASDIFALVSREDPFPLVCLEAAILGKPILCFAESGGMPEFVENDAGFVVPYLEIDAMANKVVELIHDEKLLRGFGERAAQKVRERHEISVAAPEIVKVIQRVLNQ